MRVLAALLALSLLQAVQPPQPTFRAGTNIVQVDVVVTDGSGQPVDDLAAADFQVLDEGRPVAITAFKFINTATTTSGERYPVRRTDDEEREAARDDTRLFAILLDEYHVARFGPLRVRDAIAGFVHGLGDNDLAEVFYPMESPQDVWLSYDREPLLQKLSHFEGRLHEYVPIKWPAEEEHLRSPRTIERIRTQVVLGAITAIVSHLGALKTGRKTLVWITEGIDPSGYQGDGTGFRYDVTEVTDSANRNNVSIYPVDPRGLLTTPPDIKQETLRDVAYRTGGDAIVNRNNVAPALEQILRTTRAYYLLGFESPHPADGKFHPISVRTTRSKVTIAARSGYWSLSATEEATSRVAPIIVPDEVNAALAHLAESLRPAESVDVPPARHVLSDPAPRSPAARIVATPTIAVVRGSHEPEPVARAEFARSQRIVIRATIVGGGNVDATAQLLDRLGRPLTTLPVTVFGGSCDIPLTLGSLGSGDYVVHITARRADDQVDRYVPLRVTR